MIAAGAVAAVGTIIIGGGRTVTLDEIGPIQMSDAGDDAGDSVAPYPIDRVPLITSSREDIMHNDSRRSYYPENTLPPKMLDVPYRDCFSCDT